MAADIHILPANDKPRSIQSETQQQQLLGQFGGKVKKKCFKQFFPLNITFTVQNHFDIYIIYYVRCALYVTKYVQILKIY